MRFRPLLVTLCLGLGFAAASPPAWVHHSGAMFDRSRVIELNGVVTEFVWTNPHASFRVEVPGAEGGEPQVWAIEMNGVSNLIHEGWKRSTLKPGDKVTVKVNPLRDGRPGGWYVAITLPNGTTLKAPAVTS